MSIKAKRILFPRKGVAEIEIEEPGDPDPDQVLMRTTHSLISTGTELALYLDENEMGSGGEIGPARRFPVQPGYAAVGRIERVGADVDGVTLGQRVFAATRHVSHVVFDPTRIICIPIPENVPGEHAVFVRMALITLAALCRADIQPGEWLGVIGVGIVGNLALQFGKLAGHRVVGVGRSSLRSERATECGLGPIVSGSAESVADKVREITDGEGCRFVVDTSGTSEGLLKAVRIAALGGAISQVGVPWKVDTSVELTSITQPLFSRYLSIRGGWEWDLPLYRQAKGQAKPMVPHRHSVEANAHYALDSICAGDVITGPMVTHTTSPELVQEAYDGLATKRNEYMGVIIDWGSS